MQIAWKENGTTRTITVEPNQSGVVTDGVRNLKCVKRTRQF